MKTLIITSGNSRNFRQIETFLSSLRSQGNYKGYIAICDNEISGEWDKPGTWLKKGSFTHEQAETIKCWDAKVFTFQDLISSNQISDEIIENIKSPTQRYPYKFVYNTLISKYYLNKVDVVLYFDSDVYFQKDIEPLFRNIELDKISVVKEFNKIKENYYLNNWIKYSSFEKLSSQEQYLKNMLNADNFCTGFYGGGAKSFHRFNLLALLLSSNQFVNFYSDQPLFNILTTFFGYEVNEIDYENCLHLAELSTDDYYWDNKKIVYRDKMPFAVHLNGGKYKEFLRILNGEEVTPPKKTIKYGIKKILRNILARK